MTPHLRCLDEMVLIMGHKIFFMEYCGYTIILKLSLLPLLIWSSGSTKSFYCHLASAGITLFAKSFGCDGQGTVNRALDKRGYLVIIRDNFLNFP